MPVQDRLVEHLILQAHREIVRINRFVIAGRVMTVPCVMIEHDLCVNRLVRHVMIVPDPHRAHLIPRGRREIDRTEMIVRREMIGRDLHRAPLILQGRREIVRIEMIARREMIARDLLVRLVGRVIVRDLRVRLVSRVIVRDLRVRMVGQVIVRDLLTVVQMIVVIAANGQLILRNHLIVARARLVLVDLVVNGNHFRGMAAVQIVRPERPMELARIVRPEHLMERAQIARQEHLMELAQIARQEHRLDAHLLREEEVIGRFVSEEEMIVRSDLEEVTAVMLAAPQNIRRARIIVHRAEMKSFLARVGMSKSSHRIAPTDNCVLSDGGPCLKC